MEQPLENKWWTMFWGMALWSVQGVRGISKRKSNRKCRIGLEPRRLCRKSWKGTSRKKSSCMSRKCSRKKKIDRAVDDEVYSELLPADKVEKVEELIQIKSEKENMICVFQYNSEASCCWESVNSNSENKNGKYVFTGGQPMKILRTTAQNILKSIQSILRRKIAYAIMLAGKKELKCL